MAIKIKLLGDKKALEVIEMVMDHNHEINHNAYLNLPQQRKMNDNVSSYCMYTYISSYIGMLYSVAKSDVYTT